MKQYIEVQAVCPFIGKPCIKDGWSHWDQKILRPCAFWDGDKIYEGLSPEEPCRIKRALNRILSDEIEDTIPTVVDVPWDTEEGSDSNARTQAKG